MTKSKLILNNGNLQYKIEKVNPKCEEVKDKEADIKLIQEENEDLKNKIAIKYRIIGNERLKANKISKNIALIDKNIKDTQKECDCSESKLSALVLKITEAK